MKRRRRPEPIDPQDEIQRRQRPTADELARLFPPGQREPLTPEQRGFCGLCESTTHAFACSREWYEAEGFYDTVADLDALTVEDRAEIMWQSYECMTDEEWRQLCYPLPRLVR